MERSASDGAGYPASEWLLERYALVARYAGGAAAVDYAAVRRRNGDPLDMFVGPGGAPVLPEDAQEELDHVVEMAEDMPLGVRMHLVGECERRIRAALREQAIHFRSGADGATFSDRTDASSLAAQHRARASAHATDSSLTAREVRALFRAYRRRCVYCLREDARTLDHFVPLKLGGENDAQNIVVACRSCNGRKGARDPAEWMRAEQLEEHEVIARIEAARDRYLHILLEGNHGHV